jgi:hypothetical protein
LLATNLSDAKLLIAFSFLVNKAVQLYALIAGKSKRNLANLAEYIYGIATYLMIASECLGFVN